MPGKPAPIADVIPGLTGLRGIAAAWVVAYHIHAVSRMTPATTFAGGFAVTDSGWLGVDLFFLLSGFILMHAHTTQFSASVLANAPRFLMARCWRVYPLNAAVLALLLLIVTCDRGFAQMLQEGGHANLSFAAFMRTLTLSTRWLGYVDAGWNQPVWSLSLEVIGYSAFPALAFLANRVASRHVALLVAIATLAIFLFALGQAQALQRNVIVGPLALWRMGSEFAAGIFLYRARTLANGGPRMATAVMLGSLSWIAACVTAGTPMVSVLGFGGLIWALSFDGIDWFSRFFRSPLALMLGRLSFPLYLVHEMALRWVLSLIDRAGVTDRIAANSLFVLGVALVFALAWQLHQRVERPMTRRASVLGRRQRQKGGNLDEAPPFAFGHRQIV